MLQAAGCPGSAWQAGRPLPLHSSWLAHPAISKQQGLGRGLVPAWCCRQLARATHGVGARSVSTVMTLSSALLYKHCLDDRDRTTRDLCVLPQSARANWDLRAVPGHGGTAEAREVGVAAQP